MKKRYMFLAIIAITAYWGYMQNASELKNSLPQNASSEKISVFSPLTLWNQAISSIRSIAEENAEPVNSSSSSLSSVDSNSMTLYERYQRIRQFPDALEGQIDRSHFVSIEDIPLYLRQGLIATEDRRFYEHGAVDFIGIGRAVITNILADRTLEGGSTLSQQTVKNIFLTHERTLTRKMEELLLAMQLEDHYTKDQILELYLNTVYFGHGAYGVSEASRIYFEKNVSDLDLAQCAMLAGLPQAPSAYDPLDHPEEGAKRMTVVLTLMVKEGYVTPHQAAEAAAALWLR